MIKKGLVISDEKQDFGIALGPEVDYIFDHNLKAQNKRDDTEYRFWGGKGGIFLFDKAYIYGFCGAADAEYKFKVSGSDVTWHTETEIGWGGGATVIVYEKEIIVRDKAILRIGVDGKYRNSDLGVDKITINGLNINATDASVTEKSFKSDEWQIAVGLSCQFDRLVPYGGVKYSDIEGEAIASVSGTGYKADFAAEDKFGTFCGIDVLFGDSFSAYVEGRFVDETAISGGATIRF
jgi:hypothetical protein